jgi:hypothetical protein
MSEYGGKIRQHPHRDSRVNWMPIVTEAPLPAARFMMNLCWTYRLSTTVKCLDAVWVKTFRHLIVIGQDFLSIEAFE